MNMQGGMKMQKEKGIVGSLRKLKTFFSGEEEGVGTIEIVLILVVLIALVIIFRDQILDLLNGVFENISDSVNSFY